MSQVMSKVKVMAVKITNNQYDNRKEDHNLEFCNA